MKICDLQPAPGSRPKATRKGRGIGSGLGKTAGKGHKGQKARSGGGVRPGFEGGQMPLQRRIPKRGFTNINKKEYAIITLDDLNQFDADAVVTAEVLRAAGLIKGSVDGVKVLANGTIEKAVTVQVQKCSKAALEKIEAAGGKVEVI